MLKKLVFILCPFVFVVSCSEKDVVSRYRINSDTGINLRSIAEGDNAKYLLYQSSCDSDFKFTGDTLEVSITERNDTLFMRESYTAGSERQVNTEHAIFPKDGYVLVPQRGVSQFLFFYGNDTIFLDRSTNSELVQNGCRLFLGDNAFLGDEIGSVKEFKFGEFEIFDRRGISCVPGFWQMEAYIFYEDHLNLVHTIQAAEEETIIGFMAIE